MGVPTIEAKLGIEDLFNNIAKKLVELQEKHGNHVQPTNVNVVNPTFEKDVNNANSKCAC